MANGYKYPYIPGGKNMVAAVLGACKYIRETGYFNKAVRYYADRYDVDEDELAAHIRARQAAGQRGTTRGKYKYYVVRTICSCEADNEPNVTDLKVKKALNEKNARKDWTKINRANDYGGNYAPYYWDEVLGEYGTEDEAKNAIRKNYKLWNDGLWRCDR